MIKLNCQKCAVCFLSVNKPKQKTNTTMCFLIVLLTRALKCSGNSCMTTSFLCQQKFKSINNRNWLQFLGLSWSFCRPINIFHLILKINNRWTPGKLATFAYFEFKTLSVLGSFIIPFYESMTRMKICFEFQLPLPNYFRNI